MSNHSEAKRARTIAWADLRDERVQTLLQMERAKHTRQEIADALQVSRMWIYKAIAQLREIHGDSLFDTDQKTWTAKEAAREVSISTRAVNQLCARQEIVAQRRGTSEWSISEDGMSQLRTHWIVTGQSPCTLCGTSCVRKSQKEIPLCSPDCRSTYEKNKMKKLRTQEPTLDNTVGWVHDALKMLLAREVPNSEELITSQDAMNRSGLKPHQLVWLRQRKILRIFRRPKVKHDKRRIVKYALGEIEIVARAFRESLAKEQDKNQ